MGSREGNGWRVARQRAAGRDRSTPNCWTGCRVVSCSRCSFMVLAPNGFGTEHGIYLEAMGVTTIPLAGACVVYATLALAEQMRLAPLLRMCGTRGRTDCPRTARMPDTTPAVEKYSAGSSLAARDVIPHAGPAQPIGTTTNGFESSTDSLGLGATLASALSFGIPNRLSASHRHDVIGKATRTRHPVQVKPHTNREVSPSAGD
uniref:Uncharacterized protein n=1 Tax=Mycobacterium riyadhense TaxID=486698 RepID=A0A653F2S0_9MYCO|nr:hypothetical protein BIN_B_05302 [Mycobacterium riyadhense]